MPPQRLPIVNADDGTWGDIIRQYLMKEHYNDDTNNPANGGHQFVTIRPGTTSAAPLTLSSGPLRTTPAIGAIEFNNNKLYFTQTTGTIRKTVAIYDDTSGATGDIYYRNSSGDFTRLGIGGTNAVLTVSGGLPTWQTPVATTTFSDSTFTLQDNSDATKQLRFELSGISTATTRTLTAPNANTTIVGTDVSQTLTSKTINLANNTLTGTTAQFNAALSDNMFATQAGTETLSNKTLTSPTIANFTNATHSHTNAAGGGQLNATTALNATGTKSASTYLRGDNTWAAIPTSGDASTNTVTSVDGEVVLFSGTEGKTLKRATGSGIAKLTSGVLSTATAGTDYVTPSGSETLTNKTISGSNNTFSNIPQSAVTNLTTSLNGKADATHKYHNFTDGDYYFDSYTQGRYLRLFTENPSYTTTRFKTPVEVEYHNGTSWVTWAGGDEEIKRLLDGREETQSAIDHAHRRFRFKLLAHSYPLQTLWLVQTSWTGIAYPGVTMRVSTSSTQGGSYTLRDTATFTSSNGATNWGMSIYATSTLHVNEAWYQIEIDWTDWTDSGSYIFVPMRRIEILSNYQGASLLPFSWNWDKHLQGLNKVVLPSGTTNDIGINFGADTNLYRSAANQLTTDDNLIIGAPGTVAGSVATIDGSQTFTNKTISGSNNTLSNIPTTAISGLTATAAELNILDGVTTTAAELNYVDGVTSNIQTQLNAKAPTSHTHTASQISDSTTVGRSVLTAADAAAARSAIGAGTGSGDVTLNGTQTLTNKTLSSPTFTGTYSFGGTPTWPTFNQNTTGSAATLTTARTIGLSGGVTGTATSFNGSANITIPVTALNADSLSAGTLPDARMSGVYTNFTHRIDGANTIFTTPNSGTTNSLGRTVYGLAEYRSNSATQTGAIVFYAPNTTSSIMHQLDVSGLLYNQNIVQFTVQGYRTTGAWNDTRKISTGTVDVQVRWGVDPSGKNCLILGDVGTSWSYPHFSIVRAMFSHTGTSDAYVMGWTVGVVTDLMGFTQITSNISDSAMVGNVTGNAATATTLQTARTIQTNLASTSSASFNGSANITPGVTGTLVVGNGGTGATSLTGLVKGNGTSAMTAAVAGTDYITPAGTETLSNKTINGANNTITNIAQSAITNLTADLAGKAPTSHTHTASQISDSTTVGRSVLTAADAAAARSAIGAGTGSGDVTLTGAQTLTNKTLTSPVINGTVSGTGVAVAANGSTLVLRDSSGNVNANALSLNLTSIATAAGTTTMTIASPQLHIFTGTSTQTVRLPTTSVTSGTQYRIANNSTGAVTVQSSAANTITVLAGGTSALFSALVNTPTTAAHWEPQYFGSITASGKSISVSNTLTLAGTDGTTMTFPSASGNVVTEAAAQTLTSKTLTSPTFAGSYSFGGTPSWPTFNQSTTGNAATATTLQTARTIGGVSFNGSANINLPGVNTAGNQNTTGSAATLTSTRTLQTNLGSTSAANFNGSANASIGVTGTLPVANGGTGATTLTGLVKGNGTSAFTAAIAGTDYVTPGGSETLSSKTLTTPTIASFVNAAHNHTNAAGGGQLNATTALNATGTKTSATFLRGDNTWASPTVVVAWAPEIIINSSTLVDGYNEMAGGVSVEPGPNATGITLDQVWVRLGGSPGSTVTGGSCQFAVYAGTASTQGTLVITVTVASGGTDATGTLGSSLDIGGNSVLRVYVTKGTSVVSVPVHVQFRGKYKG